MQISHVSEDNIVFIYPPSVGGSVRKGLMVYTSTFLHTRKELGLESNSAGYLWVNNNVMGV